MTADQWEARIVWALGRAAHQHPQYLRVLALQLADCDTARESLIAHREPFGRGTDGDSLLDPYPPSARAGMISTIIEAEISPKEGA